MLRVSNQKVIRRLSIRSFQTSRVRNVIAIIAIALTTLLFTSVFTIASSLNYSMQMSTMRMVGGSAHGAFKDLNKEQVEVLRKGKLIKESAANLMLTILQDGAFNKHQTELRYMEDKGADLWFCNPTTGTMPGNTYDLATDTKVLELLGVKPELGAKITLTYSLGNDTITQDFTLCGWWEFDEAALASQVFLSKEYAESQVEQYKDSIAAGPMPKLQGFWTLDVNFRTSRGIENNLRKVAENAGYQIDDITKDNYLDTGVNWAYTSASVEQNDTLLSYIGIALVCVLIFIVGYLIIYNIFGISVIKDLHFYGLLKTIGATRRQIKKIITIQALLLAVIGIPIGLLGGFLVGNGMTSVIVSNMVATKAYISLEPWIFLGAALFALVTVVISCHKPGNMAGKVSPIEALRYVEGSNSKQKRKKGDKGARISRMAVSNLLRNRKKTAFVLISLSLSIVLFSGVFTFVHGFDMDKYTSKFTLTDFIIGSANYFGQGRYSSSDDNLTEEFIQAVEEKGNIKESGRVYGYTGSNGLLNGCYSREQIEKYFADDPYQTAENFELSPDGLYYVYSYLYGLDPFAIENLKLIDGTLDPSKWTAKNPIIQLIGEDDYGKPEESDILYLVGDTVKLHYITDFEYDEEENFKTLASYDIEYEVVATAVIKDVMSYRYYGYMQWGLPASEFIEDTKTDDTMIYLYNVEDGTDGAMQKFLEDYTKYQDTDMDYESKNAFNGEFQSFQNMFLIVGGGLAIVIGLIGILNFINTTITSINTRKGEFAIMQSIGMTGKQLKKMVVIEGILYTVGSVLIAAVIYTILAAIVMPWLEKVCWFFTYHYTIVPVLGLLPIFLILGCLIPVLVFHNMSKKSVVERLRELN